MHLFTKLGNKKVLHIDPNQHQEAPPLCSIILHNFYKKKRISNQRLSFIDYSLFAPINRIKKSNYKNRIKKSYSKFNDLQLNIKEDLESFRDDRLRSIDGKGS